MRIKHKVGRVVKMIVDSEGTDFPRPGYAMLVCPVCRFEFVHIREVEKIDGRDNYEAWEGRGDVIKLHAECEGGHEYWICFGFHKGNTSVWTEFEKEST